MSSGCAHSADLHFRRRAATRYALTCGVTPPPATTSPHRDEDTCPGTATCPGATATGSNDHLAEHCRDELCHRLPCRIYKAGKRDGYDEGYNRGFLDGEAAGFSAGFAAGAASAGGG